MEEKYKSLDFLGYPKYKVSNFGNVYSMFYSRNMNPIYGNNGYYNVVLCNENGKRRFNIHRLVALAFIPNPENKYCVNHKDGNKKNNNLENLEWCTSSENNLHALQHNLRAANRLVKKETVHEICALLEKGFQPLEIERMLNKPGVTASFVQHIKGKTAWTWIF